MRANEIDDYIQDFLAKCDPLIHIALTGRLRIEKNDFSCYEVMRAHAMRPGGRFVDEVTIAKFHEKLLRGE